MKKVPTYEELKKREAKQRKERDKKLAKQKHYDRVPNCDADGRL